jgi:hypothetical protein
VIEVSRDTEGTTADLNPGRWTNEYEFTTLEDFLAIQGELIEVLGRREHDRVTISIEHREV